MNRAIFEAFNHYFENSREEQLIGNMPEVTETYAKPQPLEVTYRLTPIERDICKSVNETHPQLAPAVLFTLSVGMSWKAGELICMPKGGGKSVVLEACSKRLCNPVWADALTAAGLRDEGIDVELSNRRSNIWIDDLSTFIDTPTGDDSFKFFSQIILTQRYHGITRGQTMIENADVRVFAGATPIALRELIDSLIWFSHVEDRFFRLHYFYHMRPPVTTEEIPFIPELTHDPEDPDYKPEWCVSQEYAEKVAMMLRDQFTPKRARIFTTKLLTGHAKLCNKDKVTDEDAEFALSLYPFITMERFFVFRFKESKKEWYTAGTLKFADVFPEVLFWIAAGYEKGDETVPHTYETLRRVTQLSPQFIREIVDKILPSGLIEVDHSVRPAEIVIAGRFRQELEKLHRTFMV